MRMGRALFFLPLSHTLSHSLSVFLFLRFCLVQGKWKLGCRPFNNCASSARRANIEIRDCTLRTEKEREREIRVPRVKEEENRNVSEGGGGNEGYFAILRDIPETDAFYNVVPYISNNSLLQTLSNSLDCLRGMMYGVRLPKGRNIEILLND